MNCAPVSLERGVVKYAEGSCMVKIRRHHVPGDGHLGRERLPPWLKGQGAEAGSRPKYGMLPRATLERTRREASAGKQKRPHRRNPAPDRPARLRATLDLEALGERSDYGGLRRAAGPTAARAPLRSPAPGVALADCIGWMKTRNMVEGQRAARQRGRDFLRQSTTVRRCSTSITPKIPRPRPTPTL